MKSQLFLHFGFQLDVYIILAVKHLYGYLVGKVFPDDSVQNGEAFIHRHTILVVHALLVIVLEFLIHKLLCFIGIQLIFKVGGDGRRLDGQQVVLFVYDNSV